MRARKNLPVLLLFLCCLQGVAQVVSVSNFTLFRNGKNVILHWTLDSGATCNGTAILHAIDTTNYTEIGDIPGICGSSTTPTSYTFTDTNPILNQVNYYKLRFGFSQLSEARSILVEYIEQGTVFIQNDRAAGLLTFKFNNDAREEFAFTLYDNTGRALFQKEKVIESEIEVRSNEFEAGVYFYNLNNSHNRKHTGRLLLER